MAGNITFTMIKPDAVAKNQVGPILAKINEAGFTIVAMKMIKLSLAQVEAFYAVHKGRPFYEGLVEFMNSGPVVAAILKKDNAVADYRKLIGSTDPAQAAEGTIRKLFAENNRRNAVHGSDADETAAQESSFFFPEIERVNG